MDNRTAELTYENQCEDLYSQHLHSDDSKDAEIAALETHVEDAITQGDLIMCQWYLESLATSEDAVEIAQLILSKKGTLSYHSDLSVSSIAEQKHVKGERA